MQIMNFKGWGSKYFKGPSSLILQEIAIRIWDNKRCEESWRVIANRTFPDTTLCAGGEFSKDSCQVKCYVKNNKCVFILFIAFLLIKLNNNVACFRVTLVGPSIASIQKLTTGSYVA